MKTLFEKHGAYSGYLPKVEGFPDKWVREDLPLPQLSEVQVTRHFMELSRKNYGVDNGCYPLGSCTMKYNPKINEDLVRLEGFAQVHPLSEAQGSLELLYELECMLCEITGMDAFSLQPCAGAHGELVALMMAKKHFAGRRTKVIVPDAAHGTNPASAALCGFEVVNLPSTSDGYVDLQMLAASLDDSVAVFMLTNPNTLGLFEPNILEISRMVHEAGALMYCDGANMNAMLGITRPGDQGFDMMHLNLHKTFSVPHGGGGPGAGPVGVKKFLEPYLPVPRVVKTQTGFTWDSNCPESIGRVHSFFGNFLALVRAYAYILACGKDLKRVSQSAVLNANYVLHQLKDTYLSFSQQGCAHECVFSGVSLGEGVHTMDVAKRLLDYGFHAPTIYFPLLVPEALMIEPTETEDKATLDAFCQAMKDIAREAKETPDVVKTAPHTLSVGRLDGVLAARKPNLKWPMEERQ